MEAARVGGRGYDGDRRHNQHYRSGRSGARAVTRLAAIPADRGYPVLVGGENAAGAPFLTEIGPTWEVAVKLPTLGAGSPDSMALTPNGKYGYVGASRPRIIRMVVVFPAPFGPRKPVTRPGLMEKDRSLTATVAP
jgi:hypothetical protein